MAKNPQRVSRQVLVSWKGEWESLAPPAGVVAQSFSCVRLFAALQTVAPEKAMAPHSSTLAWKIPWTDRIIHIPQSGFQIAPQLGLTVQFQGHIRLPCETLCRGLYVTIALKNISFPISHPLLKMPIFIFNCPNPIHPSLVRWMSASSTAHSPTGKVKNEAASSVLHLKTMPFIWHFTIYAVFVS